MPLTDWIDKIADKFAFDAGNGKTVLSFRLLNEPLMPASIDPSEIFPCAMTIPTGLEETDLYGVNIYQGVTQFHVAPNLDMSHIPSMMRWYKLIKDAALAGGITLDGTVEHFYITNVKGPVALQYGNESPHWGFTADWIVKKQEAITVNP